MKSSKNPFATAPKTDDTKGKSAAKGAKPTPFAKGARGGKKPAPFAKDSPKKGC